MSANESETFYDISPIPYFPYQPGYLEWSLLGAFIILIALISLGLLRRPRTKISKAIDFCLDELSRIEDRIKMKEQPNNNIPTHLSKATLLVKRLVSNTQNVNITTLAPRELNDFKSAANDESLKNLIEVLSLVDNLRFKPDIDRVESSQLVDRLKDSLNQYKQVILSR